MKKLILLGLCIILCLSYAYANNQSGYTGFLWADFIPGTTTSISDWTYTAPHVKLVDGKLWRNSSGTANNVYLDSKFTPSGTWTWCMNEIMFDYGSGAWDYRWMNENGYFGNSAYGYNIDLRVYSGLDFGIRSYGIWNEIDTDAFVNNTVYRICHTFAATWTAGYVNGTLKINSSHASKNPALLVDNGIRFDSAVPSKLATIKYFFNLRVWNGLLSAEPPEPIPISPLSTALAHPINGTTTSSWDGFINISLFNVNGSATCTLNDTHWDFFSNNNITYVFNRSNVPAYVNYSITWNCSDTGGAWDSGSFWINIKPRLTINIYDELTNEYINESVSFIFRKDDYEYKETTTNGTYVLYNETGVPAGYYQITLNASQYYQRIYYLTVTEDQTQNAYFYLLKSNQSSYVTFYIKNLANEPIEDLSVIFSTWINLTSSNAPISHRYTDYAGSMLVNLYFLSRYGITISDPTGAYITKYTEIEPVFSSYTIYMNNNISQNFTTVWNHVSYEIGQTNMTLNPQLTNFSLITSSDNANIAFYGISATLGGVPYITNITTHPSGGTASLTLPLNASNNQNVEVNYFIATTNPHYISVPLTYSILNITSWQGNNSFIVVAPVLKAETSDRQQLLIVHFLAILCVVGVRLFMRPTYAPLAGLPVIILFAIPVIGWIPVWVAIFESILMIGFFTAFGDW